MVEDTLLSRVEDAGINASAPPEQRWLDGWLVRYSPGKAKRARCINAVAQGRLPLDDKLQRAAAVFSEVELPMMVRMTPFSQPPALDRELEQRGYDVLDDTRVMVCPTLPVGQRAVDLSDELEWVALGADGFAAAVGALRGSTPAQQSAHARRLALSPVRYQGYVFRRRGDGEVLACGQFAREGDLLGLYDVITRESVRGQGLASMLCQRLLSQAAHEGAEVAYLQVEASNLPARRVYQRLGFSDAYAYYYRTTPPG